MKEMSSRTLKLLISPLRFLCHHTDFPWETAFPRSDFGSTAHLTRIMKIICHVNKYLKKCYILYSSLIVSIKPIPQALCLSCVRRFSSAYPPSLASQNVASLLIFYLNPLKIIQYVSFHGSCKWHFKWLSVVCSVEMFFQSFYIHYIYQIYWLLLDLLYNY